MLFARALFASGVASARAALLPTCESAMDKPKVIPHSPVKKAQQKSQQSVAADYSLEVKAFETFLTTFPKNDDDAPKKVRALRASGKNNAAADGIVR